MTSVSATESRPALSSNEHRSPARERVVESDSPFWAEHRSRYHFAAQFVARRLVFDIACGAGYGGEILLDSGARVVLGADLAWDGVSAAQRRQLTGFHVMQADGTRLPLASGSVDVVTSFETVEHIPDYASFLSELRRILKTDGVLILSTPNALFTKPVNGVPTNPFHVREFVPNELRAILSVHFRNVELRGQRVAPRFRPCPYWEIDENISNSWVNRVQVNLWKAISRFPRPMRDTCAKFLLGHPLYPGEHDFVFEPEAVESGHVVVALCRP